MIPYEILFIGPIEKVEVVGEDNYFIVKDIGRFQPIKGILKNNICVVLDGLLQGTTYRILKYNPVKNACLIAKQKEMIYKGETQFHVAVVANETLAISQEQFDELRAKAQATCGLLEETPTVTFEPNAEAGVMQETPDLRVQAQPNTEESPAPYLIPLQEGQVWGIRRFGIDPSTKQKIDTIDQCRRIVSVSEKHGCCFRTLGQRKVPTSNIERRNGKPEFEYREHATTTVGVPNFRNWIRNVRAELIPESAIVKF